MTDPPRLLDDPTSLSPEELAALRAGRGEHPTRRTRTLVWASLVTQLPTSSLAAGGASSGWVGAAWLKWTLLGSAAVAGTVAGVELTTLDPLPQEHSSSAGETTTSRAPHPRAEDPRLEKTAVEQPLALRRLATQESTGVPQKATPLAEETARPKGSRSAPTGEANSKPPAPATAVDGGGSSIQTARREEFALEARLVAESRQAIRSGRPGEGLAKLRELDEQVQAGLLQQERQALRIEALWGMGERDRAGALREQFAARYPNSPLLDRLLSLLPEREN